MPENEINSIANNANMIIAGYAFTADDGVIRVLNLNNPGEACVLSLNGELIESNMDEATFALVQAYYLKNRGFMEG